ncbi:MAG: hypothetical protein K6E34_11165 [Lachnospiraceae bacterium]|nr:hypothetical protein [Lachnospiraceae bacterium]
MTEDIKQIDNSDDNEIFPGCEPPEETDMYRYFEGDVYEEIKGIITDMGEEKHSPTLFRDEIINEVCSVLISENKPNAMLIGPAGSGKTNIVEELARRIKRKDRRVPNRLYGYRHRNRPC